MEQDIFRSSILLEGIRESKDLRGSYARLGNCDLGATVCQSESEVQSILTFAHKQWTQEIVHDLRKIIL